MSSDGLAAHLNRRVDVSGTMSGLPGVTSSAAHHAYVQIRTRYGGRRARRMHGGPLGMMKQTSHVVCRVKARQSKRFLAVRLRMIAEMVRPARRCWHTHTHHFIGCRASFNLTILKTRPQTDLFVFVSFFPSLQEEKRISSWCYLWPKVCGHLYILMWFVFLCSGAVRQGSL